MKKTLLFLALFILMLPLFVSCEETHVGPGMDPLVFVSKETTELIDLKKFDVCIMYTNVLNLFPSSNQFDDNIAFLSHILNFEDFKTITNFSKDYNVFEFSLYFGKKNNEDIIYIKVSNVIEEQYLKDKKHNYEVVLVMANSKNYPDFTFKSNLGISYDEIITKFNNQNNLHLNEQYFIKVGNSNDLGMFIEPALNAYYSIYLKESDNFYELIL
jgi:hypothetical protein